MTARRGLSATRTCNGPTWPTGKATLSNVRGRSTARVSARLRRRLRTTRLPDLPHPASWPAGCRFDAWGSSSAFRSSRPAWGWTGSALRISIPRRRGDTCHPIRSSQVSRRHSMLRPTPGSHRTVFLAPAVWQSGGGVPVGFLLGGGLVYTTGAIAFGRQWPVLRPASFSYHEVVARLHDRGRRSARRRGRLARDMNQPHDLTCALELLEPARRANQQAVYVAPSAFAAVHQRVPMPCATADVACQSIASRSDPVTLRSSRRLNTSRCRRWRRPSRGCRPRPSEKLHLRLEPSVVTPVGARVADPQHPGSVRGDPPGRLTIGAIETHLSSICQRNLDLQKPTSPDETQLGWRRYRPPPALMRTSADRRRR